MQGAGCRVQGEGCRVNLIAGFFCRLRCRQRHIALLGVQGIAFSVESVGAGVQGAG